MAPFVSALLRKKCRLYLCMRQKKGVCERFLPRDTTAIVVVPFFLFLSFRLRSSFSRTSRQRLPGRWLVCFRARHGYGEQSADWRVRISASFSGAQSLPLLVFRIPTAFVYPKTSFFFFFFFFFRFSLHAKTWIKIPFDYARPLR